MMQDFGYWDAVVWSSVFALVVAVAWLAFRAGKPRKTKSFLCGEDEEYETPTENFLQGFQDSLKMFFEAFTSYQSGSINDYIAYLVIFASIVCLLLAGGSLMGLI